MPVGFGLLGAGALFLGAILLIREARLAVRSTLAELEYIKRMVARRTGAPLPPPQLDGKAVAPDRDGQRASG
jgi:hypothetical protein